MIPFYFVDVVHWLEALMYFAASSFFFAVCGILEDPVKYEASIFKRWPQSFFLKNLSQWNKFSRYPGGSLRVKRYNKYNKPIYFPRFRGSLGALSWLCDGHGVSLLFSHFFAIAFALHLAHLSGAAFWILSFVLALISRVLATVFESILWSDK